MYHVYDEKSALRAVYVPKESTVAYAPTGKGTRGMVSSQNNGEPVSLVPAMHMIIHGGMVAIMSQVNLSNGELDEDVTDDKATHMSARHIGVLRAPVSVQRLWKPLNCEGSSTSYPTVKYRVVLLHDRRITPPQTALRLSA